MFPLLCTYDSYGEGGKKNGKQKGIEGCEEMKAKIIEYPEGFLKDGHTFYRLELHAETEEDKKMLEKLNSQFVVWVSPCKSKKDDKEWMSWWGKK